MRNFRKSANVPPLLLSRNANIALLRTELSWSPHDVETRRVAYYNNIKPGTYTFRVKGCNNDGVWNETGAGTAFVLLPHFWQTKWFIGLMTLTAVGFVSGIARY